MSRNVDLLRVAGWNNNEQQKFKNIQEMKNKFCFSRFVRAKFLLLLFPTDMISIFGMMPKNSTNKELNALSRLTTDFRSELLKHIKHQICIRLRKKRDLILCARALVYP